jgi:hypothetical protein
VSAPSIDEYTDKNFFPCLPSRGRWQRWIWSSFTGIKNTFNFAKKIKGQFRICMIYTIPKKEALKPIASMFAWI